MMQTQWPVRRQLVINWHWKFHSFHWVTNIIWLFVSVFYTKRVQATTTKINIYSTDSFQAADVTYKVCVQLSSVNITGGFPKAKQPKLQYKLKNTHRWIKYLQMSRSQDKPSSFPMLCQRVRVASSREQSKSTVSFSFSLAMTAFCCTDFLLMTTASESRVASNGSLIIWWTYRIWKTKRNVHWYSSLYH